jgi:electron transfer flavoprotein beta subunit
VKPSIAVLVKSVPIGGQSLRVDAGGLTRKGVAHGLDPINEVALEWALRLRESGDGGPVTAITMGPVDAKDALRSCLGRGADALLHVLDPQLQGADVRTTALVLAAAVRHANADLVLVGNESLDGSSGATPSAVAAFLGRPLVSLARTLELRAGAVRCHRDLGPGPEQVEASLPALVSVVAGGVEPRYPKLKDVLRARSAQIPTIGLPGLGVELAAGRARERVVRLDVVPRRPKATLIVAPARGIDELERLLRPMEATHG